MKSPNGITFQVIRLHLSHWEINILDRSSFIFLLFLHFLFRYFQPDNEICSLRSQNFVDMLKIQIFLGVVVSFETKHELSLFLDRVKHFIEGIYSFSDIGVPQRFVFA